MRIRSFRWIFLFCAAALLLTLYVHIAPAIRHNTALRADFHSNHIPNYYTQHLPLHEMDTQSQTALFSDKLDTDGYADFKALKASVTLTYYEQPSTQSAIVCSVEQGMLYTIDIAQVDKVFSSPESQIYPWFGIPSYRKGWRLAARPMYYSGGWAYIRTEDVCRIALDLCQAGLDDSNRPNQSYTLENQISNADMSLEEYAEWLVLSPDRYLYDTGIYLSPDLLMQVWDTPAALLLSGSALSLAVFLLVTFRRRNI